MKEFILSIHSINQLKPLSAEDGKTDVHINFYFKFNGIA
jgi:hypothetical protein